MTHPARSLVSRLPLAIVLVGTIGTVGILATTAFAQELQPDSTDPNGAPPPPPPFSSTTPFTPPPQPTTTAPAPTSPAATAATAASGQGSGPSSPPATKAPPGTTAPVSSPSTAAAPATAPQGTLAKLDEASQKDSGVGLHLLWLQAEAGVGYGNIGSTIPNSTTAALDYAKYRQGVGPVFGVAAGVEFLILQLGARFRYLNTSSFNLWNAGVEAALLPGSGRFWPRIGVGVGYVWSGDWNAELCQLQRTSCNQLTVRGLQAGGRLGFQYFLASNFEFGIDASADALVLERPAIAGDPVYQLPDTSVGFAGSLLLHLGLHI